MWLLLLLLSLLGVVADAYVAVDVNVNADCIARVQVIYPARRIR